MTKLERTLLEVIDEASNRIAYCIDLWEMPEEAVAMLHGEIDAMQEAMKAAKYNPETI